MAYPTHEQERRFARSLIPQGDYVTATDVADVTHFVEMLVKDKNLTKHDHKTEDNADESTGHFVATDEFSTTPNDTTVQKELYVCAEESGRDVLLACGSVAT